LIDPRPYQVALEQAQGQLLQAQAQLEQAQSELERFEMLAKQDSIAKQQLDTQRALVKQFEGLVKTDQAAIDNAQLNLDYCHVNAPITGRVGLRQVDVGNYVTPGDSNGIVVLTQVKPISVMFPLPEDHMRKVSERMRSGATLTVDAYDRMMSQKVASGTLAAIDNQADTATGTFRLRALFSNDDDSLFPNQFVNVRMLLDVVRDATVIPTSAIERGQDNTFVYVVSDDNIATVRPVTLGTSEGERVQVTSGLAVGERVVTEGADRLRDGAHVLVQQPGQTAAAATPATAPGGNAAVAPRNGPGQNRPAQNAQPGAGGERRGRGQRGNGANGGGAAM
jgi:multidrug efflux system membrane fusion protein